MADGGRLQDRFKEATDEVVPPAPWLEETVVDHLRKHRLKVVASHPAIRRWYPPLKLAAGFALFALAIAFLLTVLATHLAPTGSVPASPQQQVRTYQALLAADKKRELATASSSCNSTTDSGCLPQVALWHSADQHWLDDLNHAQAPARFAAVDALMRRHIARALSYDDAMVATFNAHDDASLIAARLASTDEIVATYSLADDLITSSQGTVSAYTASVRALSSNLVSCSKCQSLLSPDGLSCQAPPQVVSTCADEIAALRVEVEAFQGQLVHLFAPDSFATKDGFLQADLVTANSALQAIERDLTNHADLVQADQVELRQAIARVKADAANIAGI